MSKIKPINGWTKLRMIEAIQTRMLDHVSKNEKNNCVYRAEDGNRCAVGVFIPDELYSPTMDAHAMNGWSETLEHQFPEIAAALPMEREDMRTMQAIHDRVIGPGLDPRPIIIKWINENVEDAA